MIKLIAIWRQDPKVKKKSSMNFELWLTRKVGHMYKLAIRALHGMVKGKALFYIERTAREISGRV